MMSHIDEGLLQAYVDDELGSPDRLAVERHLGDCLACRGELSEIRAMADELSRGLLLIDRPKPSARDYGVGLPRSKRSVTSAFLALPRAAVLVLVFGAAAAAMVPGSPLYRWIRPADEPAVEEVASTRAAAPEATTTMAAPVAATAAPEAGVSVEPLNESVRVVLVDADADLRISAVLTDGSMAGVFGTGAAASARFESAPGRLEVRGATGGRLRVELPRSATDAVVVVNGREYLRKRGDQLELLVTSDSTAGAKVTFHP